MISIEDINKAKKITNSLFSKMKKEKLSLNSFRQIFANECGFNNLSDAFNVDKSKEIRYLQDHFITYIDDPRITLEVAKEISDDHEYAEFYFKKNLTNPDKSILFPITDHYELIRRSLEILNLFNQAEDPSDKHLLIALIKISFNRNRICFTDDFIGNYGNPELISAIELVRCLSENSGMIHWLKDNISFSDSDNDYNSGFSLLLVKLRVFSEGFLWAQTNCGQSFNIDVDRKAKKAREDIYSAKKST